MNLFNQIPSLYKFLYGVLFRIIGIFLLVLITAFTFTSGIWGSTIITPFIFLGGVILTISTIKYIVNFINNFKQ